MKLARIYIDGVKTDYEVRTDGEVFSLDYNHTGKRKKLKHHKNHRGYHLVNLHINGKVYARQVHRLVAEAFIPNPKNLPQVNHKNGNKDKNNKKNLEWTTEKDNIKHALDNGLIKLGEDRKSSKITNDQARQICKCLEENKLTPKQICNTCNTTIDIVRDIRRGKTWKSISKDYKIENYDKRDEPGTKGDKNPKASISEETVLKICKLIESNSMSLQEIAETTSTTYKVIQHIYNRTSWAAVSAKFDFTKYDKHYHKLRRINQKKGN